MADQVRAAHPFAALPLHIESLLDRPSATYDADALRTQLRGRTVLITGAGGSIGRQLTMQLLELQPGQLILVDFSEFNLFHLELSINKLAPGLRISYQLVDIRDPRARNRVLTTFRPDIVFHAAAYKHVPMMEAHPVAAFQNNTIASVDLLHESEEAGVEQFIFISTDKAVAPTSVMGTTKRLTEWYVRAANGAMKTKTVRFGNVFGSLGSVVPLFIEQIQQGGPVTVTHPDMERFFMSVSDACCLILQTLLFDDAPVYTLRMDPPIKIATLAQRMIDTLSPDQNIRIDYIGIRAGEKIQEQLWTAAESPVPTSHRDIIGLQSPASYSRTELDEHLSYLKNLALHPDPAVLCNALFQTDFVRNIVPPVRSMP